MDANGNGTNQAETCSRENCGKPLDTSGYPRWCKACRSSYKTQYAALQKEMSETRGFAAGISAMRECAADLFSEYGSGQFSGYEIEQMIRSMPGPVKAAAKT